MINSSIQLLHQHWKCVTSSWWWDSSPCTMVSFTTNTSLSQMIGSVLVSKLKPEIALLLPLVAMLFTGQKTAHQTIQIKFVTTCVSIPSVLIQLGSCPINSWHSPTTLKWRSQSSLVSSTCQWESPPKVSTLSTSEDGSSSSLKSLLVWSLCSVFSDGWMSLFSPNGPMLCNHIRIYQLTSLLLIKLHQSLQWWSTTSWLAATPTLPMSLTRYHQNPNHISFQANAKPPNYWYWLSSSVSQLCFASSLATSIALTRMNTLMKSLIELNQLRMKKNNWFKDLQSRRAVKTVKLTSEPTRNFSTKKTRRKPTMLDQSCTFIRWLRPLNSCSDVFQTLLLTCVSGHFLLPIHS